MDILNQLQNIDYSNSFPEDIRKILLGTTISPILFEIKEGTYIVRTRKGIGFTMPHELSYCPANLCNNLQRASLPGHTMFYGVISDDQSHQENARAVSISECSTLSREGLKSIGKEHFSISFWEVIKPLKIISFITDTTFSHIKNNILLNQLRESFISIHHKYKTNRYNLDIIRFISSEFGKVTTHNSEYLISATISSDIVQNLHIDGIIYPSVQLGGQAGLNIAITPQAADKKLSFVRIIEHSFYKKEERSILRMEKAIEKDGSSRIIEQISNEYIESNLGINSISDLPMR